VIRAVIFDLGGVLIRNPVPGMINFFSRELRVDQDVFRSAYRLHTLEFQRGMVTEKVFWKRLCSDLERPAPASHSLWTDGFAAAYRERAGMFRLAVGLRKGGYRTGILSDTEPPSVRFLLRRDYSMFDVRVFSCSEGITKPDPEIFMTTLRRIGAKPRESVFIDDRPVNIRGADEAGMKCILFKSMAQTREELSGFFVRVPVIGAGASEDQK